MLMEILIGTATFGAALAATIIFVGFFIGLSAFIIGR